MEYRCECCNYVTNKKYNYDKHILSNKHKLIEGKSVGVKSKSKVSPKVAINNSDSNEDKYSCKYCGQKYKHKQSVTKHIKYSCTKNKTEDLTELVRLLNLQLEQQKNEFETKLQTQSKQIEKLMGKLEINGSFNNTVNITNNINLLNYKDTDTSHLTDEDYKKCLRKASRCVLKLIEKVHFNPEKPENMNVYISNMKDKYMMMYQDNKWTLTNKDELNTVYNHKEDLIEEWFNIKKDPEMEKFFNRYVELKDDKITMDTVQEEYKLLMFNNRDLIKN
jgi:hypothetical protein